MKKIVLLLIILIISKFGMTQNTVLVSANCLKFEYECFYCGKTDIYYYLIPEKLKKLEYKITIKTDEYSRVNPSYLFVPIVNATQKLNYENYHRVTFCNQSYLEWLQVCEIFPNPKIVKADKCPNNHGLDHELKLHGPVVEEVQFSLDKLVVDQELNRLKNEIQRDNEIASRKIEADKFKKKQDQKFNNLKDKISYIFNNNIRGGLNLVINNKDTSGIDSIVNGMNKIPKLMGDCFSYNYKFEIDSFEFTFMDIIKFYALSYLYVGQYEKGIVKIKKIMEVNKVCDNDDFKVYLGLAYMMNCQEFKAAAHFSNLKINANHPCGLYSKLNDLIDEMRTIHPELKCLKSARTMPILTLIMCTK